MVVQWLRFCTPKAGAWVRSLVRELDPHAATKSSHAATKDTACRDEDLVQPNKYILEIIKSHQGGNYGFQN